MGKESKDALGNRMKGYEKWDSKKAVPFLPVIARLDGRGFSRLTKGMKRPYDVAFVDCMKNTTKFLVEETGASVGYTQSDEITLVWRNGEGDDVFFAGKFQKMLSILSAMCSLEFNRHFVQNFYTEATPMFDCRVFQVPTVTEAVNCLVWREIDATKNSVQMLARCYFSHKDLHGKGRADQLDMLANGGVHWQNELIHFKRGTYFARRKTVRKFTAKERECLPPQHQAIENPDLEIKRTSVEELDFPPITKVLHAANNLLHGISEVEMKVYPTCAIAHTENPLLIQGVNGNRTHEQCADCALEEVMPMPCKGHVAGTNSCGNFEQKTKSMFGLLNKK